MSLSAWVRRATLPFVVATSLVFTGCNSDQTGPKTPLEVPASYDATSYAANAVDSYQTRTEFAALQAKLKTARNKSVTLNESELVALYAPLRALTSASFTSVVDMHLANAALASGQTFDATKTPAENGVGGVYGSFYFDKYGRDIEEHVQKGLFATMFYYQALQITADGTTAAEVDDLVALFGANPSFKNTDKAATDADVFCAAYAARRDKNDGTGLYTQMKNAFIKAQAAAKAGANYTPELNEAVADIKLTWEKSQMATAINYLYSVMTRLSATTLDDAAKASAIHSFGEASGILIGWHSLSDSQRKITTTELTELLTLLNMTPGVEPSCHVFWHDPFSNLPRLNQAAEKLQTIYGFTEAEMEDFKKNWVGEQSRI